MGQIEKQIKGKIVFKHETEAVWHTSNNGGPVEYVPAAGEKVLYDRDKNHNYTRIKYGDGTHIVAELPFSTEQSDWSQTDTEAIDYIKNKPDLTDYENVQADWNETNSSADSYIKNKPAIVQSSNTFQFSTSGQRLNVYNDVGSNWIIEPTEGTLSLVTQGGAQQINMGTNDGDIELHTQFGSVKLTAMGDLYIDCPVHAEKGFNGDLYGNATSATNATNATYAEQDRHGNCIDTTYAKYPTNFACENTELSLVLDEEMAGAGLVKSYESDLSYNPYQKCLTTHTIKAVSFQDLSGNSLSSIYETKSDAKDKLDSAKEYADAAVNAIGRLTDENIYIGSEDSSADISITSKGVIDIIAESGVNISTTDSFTVNNKDVATLDANGKVAKAISADDAEYAISDRHGRVIDETYLPNPVEETGYEQTFWIGLNEDPAGPKLVSSYHVYFDHNTQTLRAGAFDGTVYANQISGVIPSANLPSYVDDVIEGRLNGVDMWVDYETGTKYITPEAGKIYLDLSTNKSYRWSGSQFVEISKSLALGETSSTAYAGNKGKATTDLVNKVIDSNGSAIYLKTPDNKASLKIEHDIDSHYFIESTQGDLILNDAGGFESITLDSTNARILFEGGSIMILNEDGLSIEGTKNLAVGGTIKIGNTTLTEEKLAKIIKFIDSIEEVN